MSTRISHKHILLRSNEVLSENTVTNPKVFASSFFYLSHVWQGLNTTKLNVDVVTY